MIVLSPSMLAAIACIITACPRRLVGAPKAMSSKLSTASPTIHGMVMHYV